MSGIVVDNVARPLAGVRVEVVDGPGLGVFAMTDGAGYYALPAVFTDTVAVRASKDGYTAETHTFPFSSPWPPGHFNLVFALDSPSVNIAGDYTVTITADRAACAALPPETQSRTYQATMKPMPGIANSYDLVLSGAQFTPFSNTIFVRVAGDAVRLDLDPYSPEIISEAVTPSTMLTIWGAASGTVSREGITVPFDAALQYCADVRGPLATFPYVQCGVPPVSCSSATHTIALARR